MGVSSVILVMCQHWPPSLGRFIAVALYSAAVRPQLKSGVPSNIFRGDNELYNRLEREAQQHMRG